MTHRIFIFILIVLGYTIPTFAIELTIEQQAQLNKSIILDNFNPNAALNTAASKNHVAAIDYITIFYPREINQEYDNAFPLSLAASHGCVEALLKLINKGADVNAIDSYGNSALIWALLPKSEYLFDENIVFEMVEILLDFGAQVNQKNHEGKTTLMFACLRGYTSIVKLLLEHEANIHDYDNDGQSALFLALINGHAKTAATLAEQGATLNFESNLSNGYMLNLLAFRTNPETISLFIELMSEYEYPYELIDLALFKAIGGCKPENIKALIYYGANIHATNQRQYTTLHHAVISENLELMKFFIDNKVDINKTTPEGETAICIAIKNNFIKGTALLLEHNAKIDIINSEKITPFSIAALRGFSEIVELLKTKTTKRELRAALIRSASLNYTSMITALAAHDTVDARNEKLHTPLMAAAMKGHISAAEKLLEAGANIHLQDDQGSTALLLACIHSRNQMIEFLINKGKANINEQDDLKRTPLHICVIKDNPEGIKILLKYGASKTLRNTKGETPGITARYFNRKNLVELLK